MNDLEKDVRLISIKEQTKNWINGYSIFNSGKYFADAGLQNYLISRQVFKYFQTFTDADKLSTWKSR